jgi:hypothetical protein
MRTCRPDVKEGAWYVVSQMYLRQGPIILRHMRMALQSATCILQLGAWSVPVPHQLTKPAGQAARQSMKRILQAS